MIFMESRHVWPASSGLHEPDRTYGNPGPAGEGRRFLLRIDGGGIAQWIASLGLLREKRQPTAQAAE